MVVKCAQIGSVEVIAAGCNLVGACAGGIIDRIHSVGIDSGGRCKVAKAVIKYINVKNSKTSGVGGRRGVGDAMITHCAGSQIDDTGVWVDT